MQSESIAELAAALAKAQGIMKAATYNRMNPHFKNKYADLAAVWDAIRDPLSKNGLSITQTIEPINGAGTYLRTTLRHASGQWVSSMYPLPEGAKPQEMGSALTYGRRYSLSSLVGIAADEDDDANEAQNAKVNTLQRPVANSVSLSDEQTEQLMLYASELDKDRLFKFLEWLHVKHLGEIKAHQYERAMAGLRKAVGRTLGDGQEVAVPDRSPEALRD